MVKFLQFMDKLTIGHLDPQLFTVIENGTALQIFVLVSSIFAIMKFIFFISDYSGADRGKKSFLRSFYFIPIYIPLGILYSFTLPLLVLQFSFDLPVFIFMMVVYYILEIVKVIIFMAEDRAALHIAPFIQNAYYNIFGEKENPTKGFFSVYSIYFKLRTQQAKHLK